MNPIDEIETKHEFKKMYQQVGYAASLRCLYEMMISCQLLLEVIIEEFKKGNI